MENLVLIKTEDLRQLIRDELTSMPPSTIQEKKVEQPITTKELCQFLSITEPTVIRWRKKGKIPFMQIGSALRYDKEAVIQAISETKKGGFRK